MAEDLELFTSLNNSKNIDFLIGDSPEDLRMQIAAIRTPVYIYSIYGSGTKHVAWIQTTVKIKKVTKKEVKNGRRKG